MYREEGCGRPPLCHCGIFNPIFLFAKFRGDLIIHMEDPTAMGKFTAFSVKTYIPFLKDACVFVLPLRSCQVLSGPHSEEKCACDQLAGGCVQMCVCPFLDVED